MGKGWNGMVGTMRNVVMGVMTMRFLKSFGYEWMILKCGCVIYFFTYRVVKLSFLNGLVIHRINKEKNIPEHLEVQQVLFQRVIE
jgi:hypothetical protein